MTSTQRQALAALEKARTLLEDADALVDRRRGEVEQATQQAGPFGAATIASRVKLGEAKAVRAHVERLLRQALTLAGEPRWTSPLRRDAIELASFERDRVAAFDAPLGACEHVDLQQIRFDAFHEEFSAALKVRGELRQGHIRALIVFEITDRIGHTTAAWPLLLTISASPLDESITGTLAGHAAIIRANQRGHG